MDIETIKNLGLGGGGGVVGVVLTFLGFKSRLDSMEKKVCAKVSTTTCKAVKSGVNSRIDDLRDTIDHRFDTLESLIVQNKK